MQFNAVMLVTGLYTLYKMQQKKRRKAVERKGVCRSGLSPDCSVLISTRSKISANERSSVAELMDLVHY